MKEQLPLHDPDLYARMCAARPAEVAIADYKEFFRVVGEAREKYQIRDVVLASTLAIKDEEQGEGAILLIGYRGDEAIVERLLAQALGQVRSDNARKLDNLAGVNRQKTAKPKRRRADPSPG